MAHVIGEKCVGERYAQCVAACPVEAIHPGEYKGEPFMTIDPDVCISCGACKSQCPLDSIYEDESQAGEWAAINKQLAPSCKDNPAPTARPANDAPKKPGHKLR